MRYHLAGKTTLADLPALIKSGKIPRHGNLVIPDAHSREYGYMNRARLEGDTEFAFERAAEVVNAVQPEGVFFVGDVFNVTKPDSVALNAVRRFMEHATAMQVCAFGIEGNHDRTVPPLLDLWGVYKLTLQTPYSCGGFLRICGKDFQPKTLLTGFEELVDGCDLLFTHQGYKHALGFDGAWQYDLSTDIPKNVGMVISGHVHHFRFDSATPSHPAFLSPGSIYPWRYDEISDWHGLCYLLPDGGIWQIELPHRTFIDLRGQEAQLAAAQILAEADRHSGPLKPVYFVDSYPGVRARLEGYDGAIYTERSKAAELMEEKVAMLESTTSVSLIDALEMLNIRDSAPDVYELIHMLLSNPDDTYAALLKKAVEVGAQLSE